MTRPARKTCILNSHMEDIFTSEFFVGNRVRLREAAGTDAPIVLTANGVLQRSADNTFKFRQESNFWYATGIDDPDVVVVIDGGEEYLIVPTRDAVMETFEGSVDLEGLKRRSGITTVLDEKAGWERLGKLLRKAHTKAVATLDPPPAYMEFYQFYTNPARAELVRKIRTYKKSIVLVDLREAFAKLRVVKQVPEIAAIRRAVDVTVSGLQFVTDRQRLGSYSNEYEIEADITREFRRHGCGHAFDPIAVSGKRGVTMHATENSGQLHKGEMIIMDVGAEVGWYASDVARTVMTGEPSKRQRALYDAVCEAQDYAYSLIKPGVVHKEYEKENERFIGEKLRQLGIIKDTDRESIRRHFPHMMSHFVGLEAHDVGDYGQAMQAGSVMVVEPGMYSFDEGLGVRIEDMVVITENGYEHLSSHLPRTLTP